MAVKGYMNSFDALRKQFDLFVEQNKSTAWTLFRGFRESFNERGPLIYKQEDAEKDAEESFDLLQNMIIDNSAGGGDFSIYFPNKGSSNHAKGTLLFRVERTPAQNSSSLSGFSDPRLSGFVTPAELDRERRLWELERQNEELLAAINGPQNFWQQLLQSSMDDGTIKQSVTTLLGTLNNVITALVMKNAQRGPAISVQGFSGEQVPPNINNEHTPDAPGSENDYPEAMYDFAEYIISQIGDDPEVQQKFWTNLKNAAVKNPFLLQQLMG